MGTSTSKYGGISIQLETKTNSAGDTVIGTVCLNITTPINDATLHLKFKGRELVMLNQVTYREVKVEHGTRREEILNLKKESNDIINIKMPIQSWNILPVGQYVVPFNFLLPHNLPGSFYTKGRDFVAGIEYHVGAELRPSDQKANKLKFKEKLLIKNLQNNRPFKTSNAQETVQLKSCCEPKGTIQVAASIEKDILGIGETTGVVINVDNRTAKQNVNTIQCRLVQVLVLKAQNHTITKEVSCFSRFLGNLMVGSQFENHFEICIPKSQAGELKEFKGKSDATIAQSLHHQSEPNEMTSLTATSRLIKVTHLLRVECLMAGCCTNNPKIEIPVELVHEKIYQNYASAPPFEWHPKVFETVNLAVESQYNQNSDYYSSKLNKDMWEGSMDAYNQLIQDKKNV